MKNFLLLATIALSANVMAQETLTDITPAAYDWANQPVGTKMVIKHYDTSWNTPFTFSYTLGGSEYLENGGCISANATSDVQAIMDGTAVVDLGGDIGKVMCINGANSRAQEVLGFTTVASINDKIQINLFTNPDNTPRKQWIRCKIVLNIFSNEISTTDGVIGNMYFMDADNNNKHADLATYPENKINSAQFILYDDEGDPELDEDENYIYDKNRWLTFQVDFLKDAPLRICPQSGRFIFHKVDYRSQPSSSRRLSSIPSTAIQTIRMRLTGPHTPEHHTSPTAHVPMQKTASAKFKAQGRRAKALSSTWLASA